MAGTDEPRALGPGEAGGLGPAPATGVALDAIPVLGQLRPLLDAEDWPRVQSAAVRELAGAVCDACDFMFDLNFRRLRRDLDRCRAGIGECPELTAAAAAAPRDPRTRAAGGLRGS